MNPTPIVLLESIHKEGDILLKKHFSSIQYVQDVNSWQKEVDLSQVEFIITRGKGKVRVADIKLMPKLKAIARCGVGVDNIDVEFAHQQGVEILNVPGFLSTTVAEHTLMMILNLVRQVVPYFSLVKKGDWNKRSSFVGDECYGKVLGIVGLGSIGVEVARLASAFGMKVIYSTLYDFENPYKKVELSELLLKADLVTLHTALTEETEGMVNKSFLAGMKKGAYLVNLGRGELIDQEAVLEALNKGSLAGFGADVFIPEPPKKDDPLISHPQTLITPHIAALTDRTYKEMSIQTVKNVYDYLNGNLDKKFILNKKN